MREALSGSEEKVFNAIVAFTNEYGYPPSIRELCNLTEISSTGLVHTKLKSLGAKGYIKINKNHKRALSIATTPADVVEVVRCKDCEYSGKTSEDEEDYYCQNKYGLNGYICDVSYCCNGKRKEGEQDEEV